MSNVQSQDVGIGFDFGHWTLDIGLWTLELTQRVEASALFRINYSFLVSDINAYTYSITLGHLTCDGHATPDT
jgi:hypothetical protein